MNDSVQQTAHADFAEAVARHLPDLIDALYRDGVPLSSRVSVATALRLARRSETQAVGDALERFETAVRPALVTYVKTSRNGEPRWSYALNPDAQFLLEHFDRFTEVPITASWVQRVVIWARRNYRRWRKADEGHVD